MRELEHACTYLDDLLVLSTEQFEYHLEDVKRVFVRLINAGLKDNINKLSLWIIKIDCLGCKVTREGLENQPKKIKAILRVDKRKRVKDVRMLLWIIQY